MVVTSSGDARHPEKDNGGAINYLLMLKNAKRENTEPNRAA